VVEVNRDKTGYNTSTSHVGNVQKTSIIHKATFLYIFFNSLRG